MFTFQSISPLHLHHVGRTCRCHFGLWLHFVRTLHLWVVMNTVLVRKPPCVGVLPSSNDIFADHSVWPGQLLPKTVVRLFPSKL